MHFSTQVVPANCQGSLTKVLGGYLRSSELASRPGGVAIPGEGGYSRFQVMGMIFWVGKLGNYFLAWLDLRRDLSRDFWGYSKQCEDSW